MAREEVGVARRGGAAKGWIRIVGQRTVARLKIMTPHLPWQSSPPPPPSSSSSSSLFRAAFEAEISRTYILHAESRIDCFSVSP